MALYGSLLCTKGTRHSLTGQLTLSVPSFTTSPHLQHRHGSRPTTSPRQFHHTGYLMGSVHVKHTLTTNDMAIALLLCVGMSLYSSNEHCYLYFMCLCLGHFQFNILPLVDSVSSILVICTMTNLFTVWLMTLLFICNTAPSTLTDRPIRSFYRLPISLKMGAQHTDPRLNPWNTMKDDNIA